MESQIFQEENNEYEIDFSNALWASKNIYNMYAKLGIKSVDWVAETEDSILFVEYKNANIQNAVNPSAFEKKVNTDDHYRSIAQKFYDSLLFLILNEKNTKKIKYIYILERSIDDSVLRKTLRNKIKKKLPFEVQENLPVKIIDLFDVMSISEWNDAYKNFPLNKIQTL